MAKPKRVLEGQDVRDILARNLPEIVDAIPEVGDLLVEVARRSEVLESEFLSFAWRTASAKGRRAVQGADLTVNSRSRELDRQTEEVWNLALAKVEALLREHFQILLTGSTDDAR